MITRIFPRVILTTRAGRYKDARTLEWLGCAMSFSMKAIFRYFANIIHRYAYSARPHVQM